MFCPKCKSNSLLPTKLEEGLPVLGCSECSGSLVSLLYYRDWLERTTPDFSMDANANLSCEENDSKSAVSCPKCSRLMTKYLVAGSEKSRLDLCVHCDEAWLDGGEWRLLKSMDLGDRLPSIFTDQWQRKVRQEQVEINRMDRLRRVVGDADAERAAEVKSWLRSNADRAAILHFLNSD